MSRGSWFAVLLAALLLSGCDVLGSPKSSPPPKPMTAGRFAYVANRACARDYRTVRRWQDVRKEIRAFEAVIVTFRGLRPPPADRARFNRLVWGMDRADVSVYKFLDAAAAGRVRSAERIQRRINREGKRFKRGAARLGLRVCAKGAAARLPAVMAAQPVARGGGRSSGGSGNSSGGGGNNSSSKNGVELKLNGRVWRIVTVNGKTTVVLVR